MFNGLNNKLANVPTITGLSDITADSVTTDTLIVDGNDVGSIIAQVPINTADIAALKIVTTGQSYATLGDLTTFDNNVTLTTGKTMTASNIVGNTSVTANAIVCGPATFTTNAYSPSSTVGIIDSGTTNAIRFLPNAGIGAFNYLTQLGDTLIFAGNNTLNVANLTIASYSSTLSGVRITPSTTFIGAGVASSIPTSGVLCSGSNVGITGTLTLNNNLILTTPSTTLTQTELSYLDGATSNIQLSLDSKVNKTGDETISGIKTFSSVPICATNATTSTQLTNKAYVDGAISGISGFVTTNTTQSITGAKTFDGVTTTFQTNGSTATSTLNITDTGTSNRIAFYPRGGAGINNVAVVNDSLITAFGSAIDTGKLSIVPHSNTSCGIRLTNNTAMIGAGGTSIVPTASVSCSGTNVGVRGSLTLNTDVTLSQLNQMFSIRNNNLISTTITTIGLVPAGGLNKIALTDGSNPTSAQILNTTITGTNIPNQTDTYYVSAHSYNFSIQITTLSMPAGEITSINTLAIGTFITSNIGTNFAAGTYITGVAPGIDRYYISQNALNTTLFKVNHTGSLITTNLTLPAATTAGTVLFKNDGAFQFLTNNASGNQIMPLSINSTEVDVNVPMVLSSFAIFNGIASFNDDVNIAQNNITLGNVTTVNLGSGAGSNQTNLVCGSTNARSVAFVNGGNTVLGGSAGNNLSIASENNTLVGYAAGSSITSAGSSNVCVGKHSGAGISTGIQNTCVGTLSGNQTSGGTGNNNVCLGYAAGTAMNTVSARNTLIGTIAGNAITTGTDNTICGFGSGAVLATGNNNVLIGVDCGDNITGSQNICIGSSAVVPTPAGSNQIAIGTAAETMFIQGGFNWKFGGVITNSTNGDLSAVVMAQFYIVTMSAASQTITLPNPVSHTGKEVLFKRKTNTTAFSITSTGGAGFLNYGAITIAASPYPVAATIFQVDLISDGVNWCVVAQR